MVAFGRGSWVDERRRFTCKPKREIASLSRVTTSVNLTAIAK